MKEDSSSPESSDPTPRRPGEVFVGRLDLQEENVNKVHEGPFIDQAKNRFPVSNQNLDNLVGPQMVDEVLRDKTFKWNRLIRKP